MLSYLPASEIRHHDRGSLSHHKLKSDDLASLLSESLEESVRKSGLLRRGYVGILSQI